MTATRVKWGGFIKLESKSFVCGYCGNSLASEDGYMGEKAASSPISYVRKRYIYVCHYCDRPNFFDYNDSQHPGPLYGQNVSHLPDEVGSLYDEARKCYSSSAYTASVLCCRKLLMNISVSEGAQEGESFAFYVDYLSDNNYLPPRGKEWVDLIRSKGNEATHQIEIMSKEDAEQLITFIEMLLRFLYEFPAAAGGDEQSQ